MKKAKSQKTTTWSTSAQKKPLDDPSYCSLFLSIPVDGWHPGLYVIHGWLPLQECDVTSDLTHQKSKKMMEKAHMQKHQRTKNRTLPNYWYFEVPEVPSRSHGRETAQLLFTLHYFILSPSPYQESTENRAAVLGSSTCLRVNYTKWRKSRVTKDIIVEIDFARKTAKDFEMSKEHFAFFRPSWFSVRPNEFFLSGLLSFFFDTRCFVSSPWLVCSARGRLLLVNVGSPYQTSST